MLASGHLSLSTERVYLLNEFTRDLYYIKGVKVRLKSLLTFKISIWMTDQLNIFKVTDLNSRYLHTVCMLCWEFKEWLEFYELDGWDGMHVARSPFCSNKVMSLKQSSPVAEKERERQRNSWFERIKTEMRAHSFDNIDSVNRVSWKITDKNRAI